MSGDITAWPVELSDLPSNERVMRFGTSGEGTVLEDNAEAIQDQAADLPQFPVTDDSCGCRAVGTAPFRGGGLTALALMGLLALWRRRGVWGR